MTVFKVIFEGGGYLPHGEYDATDSDDGYMLLHHTGWWWMEKMTCLKLGDNQC